jgi:WD40 repeat protein
VTEQRSGEIALNVLGKTETLATVKLPQARLGPLRAAAITPDFGWLLLSNQTRGAAWDLTHNVQTLEVRSFSGAWFGPDQFAYVDVPKFDEMDRQIMQLDLSFEKAKPGYKIGDEVARQYGPYILVTKKRRKQITGEILFSRDSLCLEMLLGRTFHETGSGLSDVDVELRDIRDGHIIWSRYFPHEMPSLSFGQGKLLLTWPLADAAARDELTNFSTLKNGADKSDYLLEQVPLQTNIPASGFLIKTNNGSFTIKHIFQIGNWVIASASGNQVFTYAVETGQVKAHLFGTSPSASSNGLLAIETEVGQIKLYDIATSQLKQQYTFSDPVSFKAFSPDGSRLFVITASQTAYILDLTKSSRPDA